MHPPVGDDLLDDAGVDAVEAVGEGVDQRVVADLVDEPRDAARREVHALGRGGGEDLAGGARDLQAVVDVGGDRGGGHARQVILGGDPLGELGQARLGDQVAELGLADEHELEELVLVGVDVREHPQFLERLDREVLGLVEDQHRPPAAGVLLDEEILELGEELDVGRVAGRRHAERHQNPVQQFAAVALGVRDQPDGEVLGERAQQMAEERGLARADLAGDDGDRGMGQHAVFEHGVGPGVALGPVEEIGIGKERERPLGQPEMVVVDPERTRHTHPTPP